MSDDIEIGGHTKSAVGKRLSNFYPRPFVFDGVRCGGMEGFLQSLKCPERARQREIAALSGLAAKRAGREFDIWKVTQLLHWGGDTYLRTARGYSILITRAYDAQYAQVPGFRKDLLRLHNANIWHSIGNPDMRDTTLTEDQLIGQLERLRRQAFYQQLTQYAKGVL
jgi:hypothetical protein